MTKKYSSPGSKCMSSKHIPKSTGKMNTSQGVVKPSSNNNMNHNTGGHKVGSNPKKN